MSNSMCTFATPSPPPPPSAGQIVWMANEHVAIILLFLLRLLQSAVRIVSLRLIILAAFVHVLI